MGIVAPLPHGCRYSGKIRFIEKPGVQDEGRGGGAMWLNVVLNDPLVAYCDLLVLLPLFPTGVGILGKFVYSFYRATGGKWT